MNDFTCASFDRVLQRTSISTNIKVGQTDPLQLYLLINIYLEIKFNGSKSRGPMPSSRSLQEWLRAFQKKTADCASEGNRSSLRQLNVPCFTVIPFPSHTSMYRVYVRTLKRFFFRVTGAA